MSPYGQRLMEWFSTQGRELPWRQTLNPYNIWISEVILQQTRINQGLNYYLRFLQAFPTLQHLANAPLAAVLKVWEGLGYYSRARRLQLTAQQLVTQHGGRFPASAAALQGLPGIGPYTARAIASAAFGEQVAVLDGNVFRVLSRLQADAHPINAADARRHYQPLADAWLADNPSQVFNQAMMELGALICTPQNPACSTCPVNQFCQAYLTGSVGQYPQKKAKPKAPQRWFEFYWIVDDAGRILFHQRPASGYWQQLWELPNQELKGPVVNNSIAPLVQFKHVFTHFTMHLGVVAAPQRPALPSERYLSLNEVAQLTLPRAMHRILQTMTGLQAPLGGLFSPLPPAHPSKKPPYP